MSAIRRKERLMFARTVSAVLVRLESQQPSSATATGSPSPIKYGVALSDEGRMSMIVVLMAVLHFYL